MKTVGCLLFSVSYCILASRALISTENMTYTICGCMRCANFYFICVVLLSRAKFDVGCVVQLRLIRRLLHIVQPNCASFFSHRETYSTEKSENSLAKRSKRCAANIICYVWYECTINLQIDFFYWIHSRWQCKRERQANAIQNHFGECIILCCLLLFAIDDGSSYSACIINRVQLKSCVILDLWWAFHSHARKSSVLFFFVCVHCSHCWRQLIPVLMQTIDFSAFSHRLAFACVTLVIVHIALRDITIIRFFVRPFRFIRSSLIAEWY